MKIPEIYAGRTHVAFIGSGWAFGIYLTEWELDLELRNEVLISFGPFEFWRYAGILGE